MSSPPSIISSITLRQKAILVKARNRSTLAPKPSAMRVSKKPEDGFGTCKQTHTPNPCQRISVKSEGGIEDRGPPTSPTPPRCEFPEGTSEDGFETCHRCPRRCGFGTGPNPRRARHSPADSGQRPKPEARKSTAVRICALRKPAAVLQLPNGDFTRLLYSSPFDHCCQSAWGAPEFVRD